MQTIVQPRQYASALWGRQRAHPDSVYRLMRYVLRVEQKDRVLLHNAVTGELAALDRREAQLLEGLPARYASWMEALAAGHFLVPEETQEHCLVNQFRCILRDLGEAQMPEGIHSYIILPTTACNAKCYYCFQRGARVATMSDETVDASAAFIADNCGNEEVTLRWFGGEPTLAADRIDRLCRRLGEKGVRFVSVMDSNAYLLDEPMVRRAAENWNLVRVTVPVDGTEKTYNRIKAFAPGEESPFQRVMRNIAFLLAHGIRVVMRMNFNRETYAEYAALAAEAGKRFKDSELLSVCAHQVNEDYSGLSRESAREIEAWYGRMQDELDRLTCAPRETAELPCLDFRICGAARKDCAVITPDGNLVSCAEQIGEDQIIGNVREGVVNRPLVESWRCFSQEERCVQCLLYPACSRQANCAAAKRCYRQKQMIDEAFCSIRRAYSQSCQRRDKQ